MDDGTAVCAAMILVYGDDSSDEKRERVCAVAGVVGTIMGWRDLERQWIVRTNGIPFHGHDCDSDHGDYENTPHEENKALYRDLSIMAAESHIYGFAVAIDLIASQRVFPGSPEIAYYRAFLRVMEYMKKCAEGNREIAEFTLDMRMESEHNATLLTAIRIAHNSPRISALPFSNRHFSRGPLYPLLAYLR